jgi:hypothetical protein
MQKEPRPTMSFTDLVARKNTDALKPYIDQRINDLGMKLAQGQLQAFSPILLRLSALEQIAQEKLGETGESIGNRIVVLEDKALGIELVEGPAEAGDTVRYTIQAGDQPETFKQTSRSLAQKFVSPEDQQIQQAMVGLKTGESVSVELASMKKTYKLVVERVSRKPRPVKAPIPVSLVPAPEALASEEASATQPEVSDAAPSSDAQ